MVYPQNIEDKLGFGKIRDMVRGATLCPLGARRVDDMQFLTDRRALQHELSLLDEMKRLIEQAAQPLPTDCFFDLTPALKRVRVAGTFMETDELYDLMRSLRTIEALVRYLNPKPGEEVRTADASQGGVAAQDFVARFPLLHGMAQGVVTFPDIVRKIDQTLTPTGEIRDNASPQLAEIRREMQRNLSSIGRLLNGILRNAQAEGYVDKDTTPTMRDGRLVIPIPPSSKRRLRGIVHDESATGKTLYVEPAEVVEANNRIRELEGEERQEIIRILSSIANLIRPDIDNLLESYDFLGEIDSCAPRCVLPTRLTASCLDSPNRTSPTGYRRVIRCSTSATSSWTARWCPSISCSITRSSAAYSFRARTQAASRCALRHSASFSICSSMACPYL